MRRASGETSSLWWATKNEWLGLLDVAGLELVPDARAALDGIRKNHPAYLDPANVRAFVEAGRRHGRRGGSKG